MMNKKEFITYCGNYNLKCRYDGKTQTMYVTGNDAAKTLRHFVKAKGFKIVTD